MKIKFKTLIKTIGLFLLLLTFSSFVVEVLESIFNIEISKINTNIAYLIMFIIDLLFLLMIIFSYRKTLKEDFSQFKKNLTNNLETSFKYWIIGFGIMIISNLCILLLLKENLSNNEIAVRSMIDKAPLYMIFAVVIYAPITEELIFRKGFKDIFQNKYTYIIISGFTFGSLHVISSIETIYSLVYLIPYCSLGFAFAALYYKTKNIFSSISMHMLHNSIAIVVYLILGSTL